MTPYFADSFYYIALLNPRDTSHERALELARGLQRPLITTAWVLAEVANVLSGRERRTAVADFLIALRHATEAEVLPPTAEQLEDGLELFHDRPDKEWSLTDCISFNVMEDRGLTEALTGDRHFEQAGYIALLK